MQPQRQGWCLHAHDITVLPSSTAHALYTSTSPPLYLPDHARSASTSKSTSGSAGDGLEASSSLRLFESAVLESAVTQLQPQLSPHQQRKRPQVGEGGTSEPCRAAVDNGHELDSGGVQGDGGSSPAVHVEIGGAAAAAAAADVIMYTGGLVWCTAFCPDLRRPQDGMPKQEQEAQPQGRKRKASQPQEQQQQQQYGGVHANLVAPGGAHCGGSEEVLAVAVHPKGVMRTRLGTLQEGQGGVQVWTVPDRGTVASGSGAAVQGRGGATPRMLCCLVHQGLVTWDLQWCPDPQRILPPASLRGGMPGEEGGQQSLPLSEEEGGGHSVVPLSGVLALVLGDGSVQVVCVPEPDYLDSLQQQQQQQQPPTQIQQGHAQQPESPQHQDQEQQQQQQQQQQVQARVQALALTIEPHVRITAKQLGGSAASCVAWRHGSQPGLLVGCWDGSVCVWSLPRTASQPTQGLDIQFAARPDTQPVRRVVWHPIPTLPPPRQDAPPPPAPPSQHSGAPELAEGVRECAGTTLDRVDEHMFLAVSQGGVLRVWDVRDAACAVLPKLLTRTATYDAAWVTGPGPSQWSMHFALDDGMLRSLELSPQHYMASAKCNAVLLSAGLDPACIWSIAYSPITTVLAYGGDDGIVALSGVDVHLDSKYRRPHVPIGGLVSDDGVLRVVGPRQLAGVPCVYGGGSHYVGSLGVGGTKVPGRGAAAPASLRDNVQTLYTVCWSPNAQPRTHTQCTLLNGCGSDSHNTKAAWLAYGGAAGLVRCQRIAMQL